MTSSFSTILLDRINANITKDFPDPTRSPMMPILVVIVSFSLTWSERFGKSFNANTPFSRSMHLCKSVNWWGFKGSFVFSG